MNKHAISSSTNTFAQLGNASTCLLSFTYDPRVIYSNASKYMIGSSSTLSDHHLAKSSYCVTLANGFLTKVEDLGTTQLSPDMHLLFVLYIPSFPFNLLSISNITKNL